jgi:hypothetical protein
MKTNKEQVLAVRFADIKKKNLIFLENTGILTIRLQKKDFEDLVYQNGWRFNPGDDLNWADPDFDDSDWIYSKPAGLTNQFRIHLWHGYGWFRYRFAVDSSIYENVPIYVILYIGEQQRVYLDGKLVTEVWCIFYRSSGGRKRYLAFW